MFNHDRGNPLVPGPEGKEDNMKHRAKWLGAALAVALLALAPATAVLAQEGMSADEEVTLTGQLTTDDAGGYVLVEQESGDSITLAGSVDFAEHVDSTVNVTGKWAEDSEGYRYFEVSYIESAS